MERVALRILGCALLGSLVGEAAAGTVKVVELIGAARKLNDADVPLGSQLNTGERVLASTPNAKIVLQCNGDATTMLTGNFDAIIAGTGAGSSCAINLKKGLAVATTAPNPDQSTGSSMQIGNVTVGAKGTQFGAIVGAEVEVFVIEGTVEVSGLGEVKQLTTAQSYQRGDTAVRRIPEAHYDYLASSYAQLATSRTNAAPAQTEALKASYLRSFRNPADADARDALVKQQTAIAPNAALQRYQQSRANYLTTTASVTVAPQPAVPRHNGYRVDVCKVWGMECGQAAADEWCRRNGKQRASSYAIQQDIGASDPTVVIGTGQLCKEAYCDAFSRIVCE